MATTTVFRNATMSSKKMTPPPQEMVHTCATFAEASKKDVKWMIEQARVTYTERRSKLAAIRAVKNEYGANKHLAYFEAMSLLLIESRRVERSYARRMHEERQALWVSGGREAHYLKKFGKFGGSHPWLVKRVSRCTGMTVDDGTEPVFDVPNGPEWPVNDDEIEWTDCPLDVSDEPLPPVAKKAARCEGCGIRGCEPFDGMCGGLIDRLHERWERISLPVVRVRCAALLAKLRLRLKEMRIARKPMLVRHVLPNWALPVQKKSVRPQTSRPSIACWQADADEHGEGDTSAVQTSNVIVTEQHGASVAAEPTATSLTPLISGDLINRYPELVGRPFVYKVGIWNTGHAMNQQLEDIGLPYDFVQMASGSPNVVPFAIHRYCRGDIIVRVQLNANKFMMGQLQLAWYYQPRLDVHFDRRNSIAGNSQTLHTLINAGTSNEAVLRIPYRFFKSMMEIGRREDKSNPLEFGRFYMRVLNPLRVTSSTSTSCAYTVFVSFENMEFTGTVNANINKPSVSNSPHAQPQMEVAATIAATELLRIATDRNRDKPTRSAHPSYLAPQTAQSWCLGTAENEDLYSLRLQHAMVPHPGSYVDDPFTVSSLSKRFGYCHTYTWNSTDTSGQRLLALPAVPMSEPSLYFNQRVGDVDTYALPPVAFLSNMFQYWRGSLRFRFDFVATQMHTGRVIVGYVPGDYVADIQLPQLYSSTYVEFDVKEQQQMEFLVPYVADRLYWDRYMDLDTKGSNIHAPGYVYMFVLAPLAVMDSLSSSIEINLYISGGDDFELAVPAQPTIGLGFAPEHFVPKSDQGYILQQYTPMYVGTYTNLDINDRKEFGSAGQFFGICRYGPIYEHVSQCYSPRTPDYAKPVSYYWKLLNAEKDAWEVRDYSVTPMVKVRPAFFIPWYDGDFVYLMPARSKEMAQEWCKYMNTYKGTYSKFLSSSNSPSKYFFVYPKGDDSDPYVNADSYMRWELVAVSDVIVTKLQANMVYDFPQAGTRDVLYSAFHQMDNRLMTEGAILHSASTVASTGHGSLHFGENFSDLKDLTRRYQPYGIVAMARTNFVKFAAGAVMWSVPVFPQGLPLNIGTADTPNLFANFMREGHIPLLLSGYRYFRGGVRFRLILPDADATYFIQHIPNAKWRGDGFTTYKSDDYKKGIDYMLNHSYAYTVQTRRINQVVSFEVPYYLPYDALLLQRTSVTKGIQFTEIMRDLTLGEIRVGVLATGKVKDVSETLVFSLAYSLADDARPSTFQGFPRVCFIQDIPVAAPQGLGDMWGSARGILRKAEELEKLDLNRTVETAESALHGLASSSKAFEDTMARVSEFSAQGAEAFSSFLDSLRSQQAPQVLILALSNVVHVLNNPVPTTMAIAMVSFLGGLGFVASSQLEKLQVLFLSIFKSLQPQQLNGGEATATAQSEDNEDAVAVVSVLFAGISTALNLRDVRSSKFTKGLALDLVNGVTTGCKDGSFFFRFLSNVVGVIIKIFNYMKGKMCPVTLGLENLVSDQEMVTRWAEECIKLTDVTLEPLYDVMPMLVERVHACYVIGSLIYTKLVGAPKGVNVAVLKDLYTKIVSLKTQLADRGLCSSVRREPFVVCMQGDPGIGKSHMASIVLLKLLRDAKIPYDTAPIYSHPAGAKYWENVNQEPAMLMDDAFVLRTGETADSEVATLMSLKSCALFTPPIAACDRKKKRYAPEIVYYHTNVPFPALTNMSCSEAIYRRRDLMWQASLKRDEEDHPIPMSAYTPDELDDCRHLRFRFHRAPADATRAHDWSDWIEFDAFYAMTLDRFISFRNKQIYTHSKKVEFLAAATAEIAAYPELNQMPLMDILKLYDDGKRFEGSNLYQTETKRLIAEAQGLGRVDIFKKYLAMKVSENERTQMKYLFDMNIIKDVKSIVEHVLREAGLFPLPEEMESLLFAVFQYPLLQKVFRELEIINAEDHWAKLRTWVDKYRVKFVEEAVQSEPASGVKPIIVTEAVVHRARSEVSDTSLDMEVMLQVVDAMCPPNPNVENTRPPSPVVALTPAQRLAALGPMYERIPLPVRYESLESLQKEYAERMDMNKPLAFCKYHDRMLRYRFHLTDQVELEYVKEFGWKHKLTPDEFMTQLLNFGCPHYFIFLRKNYVRSLTECCFRTNDLAHFCRDTTHCDPQCPVFGDLPLADSWEKCPFGRGCVRYSKLEFSMRQMYAVANPGIVHTMVDGDEKGDVPVLFREESAFKLVGPYVKTAISDMFKQLKKYVSVVVEKFWGVLGSIRSFFVKYGKWLVGAIALIGGGFALWKHKEIASAAAEVPQLIRSAKTEVVEFGSAIKEKFSKVSLKSKDDFDLEVKEEVDLSLKSQPQIIASGAVKSAAVRRTAFVAKTIENAQAIMGSAHHQIDHHDVVTTRIVRNTLSIVGFKVDESGAIMKDDSKYMRALALGDRYVLTNWHCIEIFRNFSYVHWRVFITDRACDVMMDDVKITRLADSTLCVLKMPASFPQFKRITQYFASEADHILRTPTKGQVISIRPLGVSYVDCAIRVRHKVLSIDGVLGSQSQDIANLYEYEAQAPGMCGSLLVAPTLGSPIIGMHIAGIPLNNLGFAEPLFKETFEVLFSGKITDIQEPEFLPVEEATLDLETTVFPVGVVPKKFVQRQPPRSGISQSAIFGYVKPTTEPAPLSGSDPRLPPNSSPLVKGCEKHGIVTKNFPMKCVDRAKTRLLDHLVAHCKPMRCGRLVLTDQQAVCGDSQLPFCDPLNWQSSEGYPFSSMRPGGATDKKWLFDLKETQSGLHLRGYKEPLKAILLYRRAHRAQGEVQPTIFTDCLKDARISKEKCCIPGKTRIFSMSPVDYTIEFRRYFYDFIASYQSKRFDNFNMIGINVFGEEWDVLARKLRTYDDVCTGDYSNFGPGLNEVVAQACTEIICEWYSQFDEHEDIEDKRTRACLMSELIGSLHLCKDVVYRVVAGIPSGSPITVVLNSLVNTMYLFIAWDMLSQAWPVHMRNFSHFKTHILLYTYGDDFIFSVSPVYRDYFNSKVLSIFFSKFNIKLTDAFKGEEVTPYASLEESSFLKGKFIFFLGQYWYGLDTDQVFDMVNYVSSKHNKVELTLVNAEQALLHAHGHGKTFFNEVKSRLTIAFRDIGVAFHGRTFAELTSLKRDVSTDPMYEHTLKKLLPLF